MAASTVIAGVGAAGALAGGVGGLIGSSKKSGSSGSSGSSVSLSHSDTLPPAYAQDYAKAGLQQAYQLSKNSYTPYPFIQDALGNISGNVNDFPSLISPMNTQQNQSLDNIFRYANSENPVISGSMGNISDTLAGNYLTPDSNPYLAQFAQEAMGDVSRNYMNSVVPQYSAAASRAGAFGGSADTLMRTEGMRNLGDMLSKTATNIYAPAYQQERQNQMQANALAPQTIQMPLSMQAAALGVGDVYQKQEQAVLNDRLRQWSEGNQWPFMAAQAAAGMFPIYGWGNSSSGVNDATSAMTAPQASPASQGLGGALLGGGLGMQLGKYAGGLFGSSGGGGGVYGSSGPATYTSPGYYPGGYGYQTYGS